MMKIRTRLKHLIVDARRAAKRFRQLDREAIASLYLDGHGIEIGGLHNPLKVPARARVRYVDRMDIVGLREQYPELAKDDVVGVDIIDDGETLKTIGTSTQDFVIANHFLEHCENTIGALENMVRVLKPGGVLFLCIPDKRHTFDSDRPVTTFEHLLRDYREGPAWSRRTHYEEWAKFVDRLADLSAVKDRMEELLRQQYSIHFHVWTINEMIELFQRAPAVARVPAEIDCVVRSEGEVILLLRKQPE